MRAVPLLVLLLACDAESLDVDTDETTSTTPPTTSGSVTTTDGWLWPIPGEDGRDWVINNYVDHLQGDPGMEDYTGATGDDAKTYDDHRGIDIDIANFRAMDEGVSIIAVVGGEVFETTDGFFDRETDCDQWDWNAVIVESDDGYVQYYGHMRNGSLAVSTGDRIETGDALGLVGSSGCSSGPHLHFEVWQDDVLVDPFTDGLFGGNAPVYDTPPSLMEGLLKADGFVDFWDIQDPGSQATQIQLGQEMGFGVSMAGGSAGDEVLIEVFSPDGGLWEALGLTFDQTFRHSMWYWNRTPDQSGQWTADYYVEGVLFESHGFQAN